MARSRTSNWLILSLLIAGLHPALARGQSGPAVEVFSTAHSAGGVVLMPLEQLPVQVTVSVSAGYDTNAATTTNSQGSLFASVNGSLGYSFGTERTRFSMGTSASFTYYDDSEHGGVDYSLPKLILNLGITHAVSERLSLSGNILARYGDEPDFALGIGPNRRSGNFFFTADSISASYQWLERFSTVTSYSFDTIQYEDAFLALLQDRINHTIGEQFRFVFLPMTTLTADYTLSLVRYDFPNRDSTTHSLLGGIEQTLGPHLQASFRAGVEFRESEQEKSNSANPYFNGTLSYLVSEKTSANWNINYATTEADVVGASSRTSLRSGLGMTYQLTARISSGLNVNYSHDMNAETDALLFRQPSFSEDSLDAGFSLQYAINPRLSANAGFNFTKILSDVAERAYSRSHYSAGMSYSF